MSMEHWWKVTDEVKPKYLRGKPVAVALFPTRISHTLALFESGLCDDCWAIKRLSRGSAHIKLMASYVRCRERNETLHRCAGGLWLQGHTARASLLCSVGKIFHCVHYLSADPRNMIFTIQSTWIKASWMSTNLRQLLNLTFETDNP